MRVIRKLAVLTFVACAGVASAAQAAPMPVAPAGIDQPSTVETVQYGYGGGHRYRAYERRRRVNAFREHRYRLHVRRERAHIRRAHRRGFY